MYAEGRARLRALSREKQNAGRDGGELYSSREEYFAQALATDDQGMHAQGADRRAARCPLHWPRLNLQRYDRQRLRAGRVESDSCGDLSLFCASRPLKPALKAAASAPALAARRIGRGLLPDSAGQHLVEPRPAGATPAGHHWGLLLRHAGKRLGRHRPTLHARLACTTEPRRHLGLLRRRPDRGRAVGNLGGPHALLGRVRPSPLSGHGLPNGDRAPAMGRARAFGLSHGPTSRWP